MADMMSGEEDNHMSKRRRISQSNEWNRRSDFNHNHNHHHNYRRNRRSRSPPASRGAGPSRGRFRPRHDWDSIENNAEEPGGRGRFGGSHHQHQQTQHQQQSLTQPSTHAPDPDEYRSEKTFKQFVFDEPDDVQPEQACLRYAEYLKNFEVEQVSAFFARYKDSAWFKERYDVDVKEKRRVEQERVLRVRAKAFFTVYEREKHVLEAEMSGEHGLVSLKNQQILNDFIDKIDLLEETASGNSPSAAAAVGEEGEEGEVDVNQRDDQSSNPPPFTQQCIHLRSCQMSRSELEVYFNRQAGYKRLALSDPALERNFIRRAWVTFDSSVPLTEICQQINNDRCGEAIVMDDMSRKFRAVNVPGNIDLHFELAERIAERLDREWMLEKNSFSGDILILYLRLVYSVDFYNGATEYQLEHYLPCRCSGVFHVRGGEASLPFDFQCKLEEFAQSHKSELSEAQCLPLGGLRDEETEVELFVERNCQKLSDDKWLCPISGKKFKGPDFVRKHLFNKHPEKIEAVHAQCRLFNAYLRDPKRPKFPNNPLMSARKPSNVAKRQPLVQPTSSSDPTIRTSLWNERQVVKYEDNTYNNAADEQLLAANDQNQSIVNTTSEGNDVTEKT